MALSERNTVVSGTRPRRLRQTLLALLSDRFRHHVETCIDLRGQTDDPLVAACLCPEQPFVIEVAGAHCRGLHALAYPMTGDGAHPFVDTVRRFAEGATDYAGSPLARHYARVQPRSAAEAIGVTPSTHPELCRPALAATLPWDFRSPAEAFAFWQGVCARDYREHGFALDASAGWKGWGPVSAAAGEAELTRLLRVWTSIRAHGYRRHAAHDGDIMGVILRHRDASRVILTSGQHRAAVLVALGETRLPVRLTAAVTRREDVALWPNVRRGIFSEAVALAVFDRAFAGKQPGQALVRPTQQRVKSIPARAS